MVKYATQDCIDPVLVQRQMAKLEAIKQAMRLSLGPNIEVCMVINDR